MAIVIPNNGESVALQLLTNKIATPENLVLRLFSSNTTPGEADTTVTYTEVTGSGYSAITLTGASWTVSGTAPTSIGYAKQTFTFTGAAGNVYGYFLTRASSGDLIGAERFTDGPYLINVNGDKIEVTVNITAE
jgi:hypothetical protein